ncbi:L-Ala-D/L-Glu epimerase [Pigmentiphaga humi]|uniref:L-Ala-D/L-Glu epimerase n=1 Tax=Pigmentiphaga humi TaxID=2478468 RepID=A0A3P4B862_9BURK|nr:enolase C-terminal domain-like protein [Pigmentiphaga humi]VCU72519.1 L-Ala-D/L-Glu epimerase [Pigmentiphaga humi]
MTDSHRPVAAPLAAGPGTIERIDIIACSQRQDDPTWRFARGVITHVDGWIIRLVSRRGEAGFGHVLGTPIFQPDVARIEPVLEALRRETVGRNVFELEALHRRLEGVAGAEVCALSGFVCAAYDLQARMLGLPLHALLGGKVRAGIEASRIVSIKAPDEMAAQAARLAGQGYRNLKLKLSGEPGLDVARVSAVRQRVGPQLTLTVDANQAYDADTAIRVCRELRPLAVEMMEQPVPAADVDGLCRVHAAGELPIEADESIGDLAGLMRLIALNAADSYNLKLHYLGGIRNTLTAMRICEAAGVGYRFGAIFGPRLLAAQGVHLASLAATIHAGAELAEFDHLLDDPFTGLDVRNGELAVSDAVASGVEFTAGTPA